MKNGRILACPRTGAPLRREGDFFVSGSGPSYPAVDGIPVMLRDDVAQTIGVAARSLDYARGLLKDGDGFYRESLGISEEEKALLPSLARASRIDPAVSLLVAATNGMAYKKLVGRLDRYPIPEIPLERAAGAPLFLDIGCNWGRWCVAAARKGYDAVGLDPSLGAVAAGRRVARELGHSVDFVVGDGRFLPFLDGTFDVVFSYSVLQHMSRADVRQALKEASRVLKPGGRCVIEMPNRMGLRCLYHQARRGFREGTGFEVRYWGTRELRRTFGELVGPAALSVDCFFGIGLKETDASILPPVARAAALASGVLERAGRRLPWLAEAADSVFVTAVKPG